MSHLQNKSELLVKSAKLLHEKGYYPAVAHSAYYSCYQLSMHIWLYSMKKSEEELKRNVSQSEEGSHEYLLNSIIRYINTLQGNTRNFRNVFFTLKRLRTKADYKDVDFSYNDSEESINLSNQLLSVLKKY